MPNVDKKPEVVLSEAITKNGKIEDCKRELGQLENVDEQINKGHTLLYVAVDAGRKNWVETLLDMGADPFTKDPHGVTVEELARVMYSKHPNAKNRKVIVEMIQERQPSGSPEAQDPGRAQNDPGPENRNLDLSLSEDISCLRTLVEDGLQSIRDEISELKHETSQRDAMLKNLESGMAAMNLHAQGRLESESIVSQKRIKKGAGPSSSPIESQTVNTEGDEGDPDVDSTIEEPSSSVPHKGQREMQLGTLLKSFASVEERRLKVEEENLEYKKKILSLQEQFIDLTEKRLEAEEMANMISAGNLELMKETDRIKKEEIDIEKSKETRK